jgi:hypothetical protein
MRLPFTIEKLYTTRLSFDQIVQELENKNSMKYLGGLRVDKYKHNIIERGFFVQRYSNGANALSEYFPLIKGEIVNEKPMRVYLTLKPSYVTIIFFFIFVFGFGYAGIFVDNWTINGVKRLPTVIERLFIVLLGSGIPFLWCFVQYIRPIKKAEKWIAEKLDLVEEL